MPSTYMRASHLNPDYYNLIGQTSPFVAINIQRELNVDVAQAGLLFSISGTSYMLFCPLSAFFSSRYGQKLCCLTGITLMVFGFSMLGPVPFLSLLISGSRPLEYVCLVVARALVGTGCALAFVPSLPMLLQYTQSVYPDKHITGAVSSLWNSSTSMGQVR